MTTRRGRFLTLTAVLVLGLVSLTLINAPLFIPNPASSIEAHALELPLAFAPTGGYSETTPAHFMAQHPGGALFFAPNEVVVAQPGGSAPAVLGIRFLGSSPAASIRGLGKLPGVTNYIIGDDPAQWRTDVPTYAGILYEQLYAGVDLRFDGVNGRLKGTYYVAAGAEPAQIRWQHAGATAVAHDAHSGDLHIRVPGLAGDMIEQAPIAWQTIHGNRFPVDVRYTLADDGSVGFALGQYDPAYPLVIDPTLVYAATFGGSGAEFATGIAIDDTGAAYIVGTTFSTDFPHTKSIGSPAIVNVFVTKINPAGDAIVYSTFIGGSEDDEGTSIAVDGSGSAYVAGATASTNFPTKNAVQAAHRGMDDAFVLKLNPAGNDLVYSTFLGGSSVDNAEAIALDADGAVYLTGTTGSANFPLHNAYDNKLNGVTDAFVTALNGSGAEWLFSTYLGGGNLDSGGAILVDSGGNVHVSGATNSDNFPVANAYQQTRAGNFDVFVSRFNSDGSTLLYSSYLGGGGADYVYGMAVTSSGNVVLSGETYSTDFPTQNAYQGNQPGTDAFVTMLTSSGDALAFSTYLGGSADDKAFAVDVDAADNVFVTGSTFSANFPAVQPLQAGNAGNADAFVAQFAGTDLVFSTCLGGAQADNGHSIAVGDAGAVYVTGITDSAAFLSAGLLPAAPGGATDVFVVKIDVGGSSPPPPPPTGANLLGSFKSASQHYLAPDETLTFTVWLHNSGTDDATVDVVDEIPAQMRYVAGSASHGGSYDTAVHTVSWQDVPVPSGADVALTFAVTADVDEPMVVTNTAVITPAGQSAFERATAVLLSPVALPHDAAPPIVHDVTIGQSDVLIDPQTTIHIDAGDNVGVEKMYIREWVLTATPYPHWQVQRTSGWVPFDADYPWTLVAQSGAHFITVWVADAAGNVSLLTPHAADYASLLLPDTTVAQHGLIPYLVHYEAGANVTATVTPSAGDADLYVWYPHSHALPDQQSVNGGTAVDAVSFTAPETGAYLFVVHGYQAATYTLSLVPGGGAGSGSAMMQPANGKETLSTDPILPQSGLDPLATAVTPEGPYTLYMPILLHTAP